MLAKAYVWDNEMVMAFDEDGQQIPELQGPVEEVAVKLLKALGPEGVIRGGVWRETKAATDAREYGRNPNGPPRPHPPADLKPLDCSDPPLEAKP